jgi:PhnB protein
MTLNTYLFFNGKCGEAFDFYRRVFGGDFAMRMTYADAPEGVPVDRAKGDRIMHVALPVGGSVLMGSDSDQARPPQGFSISYSASSREDADAKFAALTADGGRVVTPMENAFWGSYFGMLRDRYDVEWMISHDQQRG